MVHKEYRTERGFELRLEAILRNAKLIKARETLGLSAPQAAEKIGISYFTYNKYESMRGVPSPEYQEKICEFYRKAGVFLLEEEVFPEELRHVKPKKYVAEVTIPTEQLVSLSGVNQRQLPSVESAEQDFNKAELVQCIDKTLASLTEREEAILRLRYFESDDLSFSQISKRADLDVGRVKQIHERALRKLRDPAHGKRLFELIDGESY